MKKKITAIMLLVSMLVSNIPMMVTVEAAEAGYEDKIVYEDKTSEFKSGWKADGTGTVPKKEGYVFGGWYVNGTSDKKALNVEEATEKQAEANLNSGVYAKFVPAYVLSVKTQQEDNAAADNGRSAVRIISALDSLNYEKVGFDVLINNKNKLYHAADEDGIQDDPLETTTVYTGLIVGTDTENPRSAETIFGSQAKYLSVWRLSGIADAYDAKIINVTPYWYTLDGTKVSGLTKYIHIEDGYKDYISVPINLSQADAMVAAGKVQVTYDTSVLELADSATAIEYDGVFKAADMTYADNKNGTITITGNADVVNTNKAADGIFANVRFHIKNTETYKTTYGSDKASFLTFTVNGEEFCNWAENDVAVNAWDIQH